jgi:hypothetical protein
MFPNLQQATVGDAVKKIETVNESYFECKFKNIALTSTNGPKSSSLEIIPHKLTWIIILHKVGLF